MQIERKQCPFYMDEVKPFAQRTDGMSLDIIHPKDIPRGKIPFIKDEDRSLKTTDIDRAAPHYPHLKYLQKPDYSVGCTDPDHFGGRARTHYAPMDRRPRDLSLTTADIEYAQTKASKFKGNRHTDPVCPNYDMPSSHVRPVTPPRWNGRHCHDITDIEKSCSKVRIPNRNYVRDPNDGSDIEYASANYQERVHRRTRNGKMDITLNVKDINQTKPLHYAPRCTNPLEPEYKVSTTGTTSLHTRYTEELSRSDVKLHPTEAEIHGHVHGSKPRKLQWDNGEPQLSLVREDIAGTVPQRWVGACPVNIYDPPEVKQMISFHDPHDITGAQVGTLKKGIEGSRRGGTTNPLNPRYKMLDGDVRPQPVPVFDAERNVPMHSLMQSRAQAASLPNLRPSQGNTPVGSCPPSQRGMQRDASDGMLRRRDSPAGSQRGGFVQPGYVPAGAQPGYVPSAMGTPAGQRPGSRLQSGAGTPTRGRPGYGVQQGGPGNGTPARGQSGRGTPSGQAQQTAAQYGPPPGGNYTQYGPQDGEYPPMDNQGSPSYGQPGQGQYFEQYRPPQDLVGEYGGPTMGGGQYASMPPGQPMPPGQTLPPGYYDDGGYDPEGYAA